MTLYFAPQPITVHLTEMQLPAAIEAAHDALIRRVAWTVFRSARWEGVDWETVRTIVDSTASLYMTLMFVAKDQPAESFHEKFFGTFMLPKDVWDLVSAITFGEKWEDVPTHPHNPGDEDRGPCDLCDRIMMS